MRKPPSAGIGRVKGVPNKVTADVRATIALLAERNVERIDGWLTRVAKKNPGKAADLLLRALEYHIPKLARTELVGKDGEAVEHSITVTFVPTVTGALPK